MGAGFGTNPRQRNVRRMNTAGPEELRDTPTYLDHPPEAMNDHNDDEWGPNGFLKYLFFPLWALWLILKAVGALLSDLARRLIGLFHTGEDE